MRHRQLESLDSEAILRGRAVQLTLAAVCYFDCTYESVNRPLLLTFLASESVTTGQNTSTPQQLTPIPMDGRRMAAVTPFQRSLGRNGFQPYRKRYARFYSTDIEVV